MTKSYFPFDAGAGADVAEAQWKDMASFWRQTGVLSGELNELEVYGDSSGMQVKVKSGKAWVEGFYFESDSEEIVAISAADLTNDRIDRVVVEVDWTNNIIDLSVVEGTPAGSPSAPALTQNSSVWQISLAQVLVQAAASTIAAGDMTNERTMSWVYGPNPNVLINGNMDVWQRNTTFTGMSGSVRIVDQCLYVSGGGFTGVYTGSQSTDVPTEVESGIKSNYSLKLDCTMADASIASGEYSFIRRAIEGYDYAPLKDNTVTLSFWVKATKTGVYCVGFQNNGQDRSYVAEYTVESASTWEKKTITLTLDQSGGTEDFTNGAGLYISFALSMGSTRHTTPNAWQTGNYFATANQVNACDNTANEFYLAQLKLELGNVATPIVPRPFSEELELCKRYFQKSYQYASPVGSSPNYNGECSSYGANTYYVQADGMPVSPTMRDYPTVTVYSPINASVGQAYNAAAAININWIGLNISNNRIRFYSNTAGCTSGHQIRWHYTLDSEL
jgi:hypothetical protein